MENILNHHSNGVFGYMQDSTLLQAWLVLTHPGTKLARCHMSA